MRTERNFKATVPASAAALLLQACTSVQGPPVATVDHVDLERFMGDWYVVANIPTFIEKDACNAVESYRLLDDGRVATTFSFNAGGCDGPRRTYHPVGYVLESTSNAVWGMQFLWPFKADYRVMHLDADYTRTVIGRNQRDYLWIMARTPQIPEQDMQQLLQRVAEQGYDPAKVLPVTQQWPAVRDTGDTP